MNFKITKYILTTGIALGALSLNVGAKEASEEAMSIKVPESDKTSERMQDKLRQEKLKADRNNSFLAPFSGSKPELQADEPIVFDEETQTMYAKGNVKIQEKLFEIDSDEIEYSPKSGYAKVKGDVRVSLEDKRIVSSEAKIDLSKNKISSDAVRMGTYPMFVDLKDFNAEKAIFSATKAKVYHNEPAFASLNIQAEKFDYNSETKMLDLEDVTIQVGSIPLMYIPSLSIEDPHVPPIKLKLEYGYNDDLGYYGANSILYTAFENISPGAYLDFYTSRGVLAGPAADFNYKSSFTRIWGTLRSGYIHDDGLDGSLAYDSQRELIDRNRSFIDLDYKQKIGDNIEITAAINYWSDSEVLRDFKENLFDQDEMPDNFVEIDYYGDDYIAAAFARFQPNDWEEVQQRLPEISFTSLPINLFGVGVYQNAYASYVNLKECMSDYTDSVSTNRFDAYYGLDMPIALNNWSTFTPVVGARASYYTDTAANKDYTKVLGQVGFDFNMNAWGTFEIESNSLDINGLRHNLRPVMMYRYIPAASQGSSDIYAVDEEVFSTRPDMLDLGLSRDIDTLDDINTLRLGLENTFYTRTNGYGSRKVAALNFYQDINFTEQKVYTNSEDYKYSHYSNLFAGIDLYPASWISCGVYSRTDIETGIINQADFYIRLSDADAWSAQLSTNYMENQIDQYNFSVGYKFTENYSAKATWKYDVERGELTSQVYTLQTRLGNSWIISYEFDVASGSSRDDGVSFSVAVQLVGF